MSRRHGNGRGSVYQRKQDGRWTASVTFEDPATGRRRRCVAYAQSKPEALDKLDEMRRRVLEGEAPVDAAMKVTAWLEHWRDTTLAVSDRKATTKQLYAKTIKLYLIPLLGDLRLDRLRPSDVERMLLTLRERGLSGQTRRLAYNVTRTALDAAVRDGLVRRNVAAVVDRPAPGTAEATALSADQVAKVLEVTGRERLGPLVVVLAYTGLRIGEALALRWQDVDLEAGTLRVTGTLARVGGRWERSAPKSERSRRTLPIPAVVVAGLRRRLREQREERLKAGIAWQDAGLVFATEAGGPLDHRNVLRWYQRKAAEVNVPGAFHTLRHSAATALMEAGVPLRVVADVLGHSSTRLTADTYSHVSMALTGDALAKLESAF